LFSYAQLPTTSIVASVSAVSQLISTSSDEILSMVTELSVKVSQPSVLAGVIKTLGAELYA